MTSDENAPVKQELNDLEVKYDRLEQQIKKLDHVGQGRFESILQTSRKILKDVENKIEELTTKVEE